MNNIEKLNVTTSYNDHKLNQHLVLYMYKTVLALVTKDTMMFDLS